ncbi:MAG: sulfocyanin-like copper-binding protein, partial [Longimicrobiales bacterium]
MNLRHILPVAAFALVACGGGEPADDAAPSGTPAPAPVAAAPALPTGPLTTPEWFHVIPEQRMVHMIITAGATPDQNYWNFNGALRGNTAITVPEGYTVEIEFTNHDPNMAHSLGIHAETANFSTPPQPTPVFAGAISQNPGSMIDGTMPNETETVRFVAERAGHYSMVCFIPGHSAIGMWLH